jgi:serine protease
MAATIALAGALCAAGAAALAGLAATGAVASTGTEGIPADARAFVPGELLVRFRGEPQREVKLPAGVGVRETSRTLERNPHVRWAVPNYVARASGAWIPNDPGERGSPPGGWQQLQWNFLPCGSECGDAPDSTLEAFGGIDAPGAWWNLIAAGRPGAKGVKIAVVDTGVALRSRGERFQRSPDLKRGQFGPGRDFVEDDMVPLDENGHGTHVASTIGERTNNGRFVTGLAYRAKLIVSRVLDENGVGGSANVARGIRWGFKHGADVINLSLEFPRNVNSCEDVPSVCEAINRAHAKGTVIVGAAGNGGVSGAPEVEYPGRAPNVFATGATTVRGCLADYSNFGEGLDIVAPGGGADAFQAGPQCRPAASARGIVQLTLTNTASGEFTSFDYPHYEGTSMASAHVAGVAALVWAALREQLGRAPTPEEVEGRMTFTARREGGLAEPQLYGAGLLNAAAATVP